MALLFISTTHPSEFAASLARIGVSYKVGYSVAIALRYIPDVQRDFHEISQSQQSTAAGFTIRLFEHHLLRALLGNCEDRQIICEH